MADPWARHRGGVLHGGRSAPVKIWPARSVRPTPQFQTGIAGSDEPVADTPYVDHPAPRAPPLELAPQATGVTVDGAGRSARSISPHHPQQLVLGEHALRLTGELYEQIELQPPQADVPAMQAHSTSARIDRERPDLERSFACRAVLAAAQDRPQACPQLEVAGRPGKKIIRSRFERSEHVRHPSL